MRDPALALAVALVATGGVPHALCAQQGWKVMLVGDKPARAVQWSMAVDSQRVVREADGTVTVLLRWQGAADSPSAVRTERIERHRLDCAARQSSGQAVTIVPNPSGGDALVVSALGAEGRLAAFPSDGPEREFFDGVCQWTEKAVPRR